MYRDKGKQKEAARLRKQRQRDKEGVTSQGVTLKGVTQISEDQRDRFPKVPLPFGPAYYKALAEQRGEGVKPVEQGIQGDTVPAVYLAISDPRERGQLEKICESLKSHGVLGEVRYGVSGPTFDVVSEMLAVT